MTLKGYKTHHISERFLARMLYTRVFPVVKLGLSCNDKTITRVRGQPCSRSAVARRSDFLRSISSLPCSITDAKARAPRFHMTSGPSLRAPLYWPIVPHEGLS